MKPFEVGKTYKTAIGDDVRVIATDVVGPYPICGLILYESDTEESAGFWSLNGQCPNKRLCLIPEKETRTVWISVYPKDDMHDPYYVNESKEDADHFADVSRIACIPVTFDIP